MILEFDVGNSRVQWRGLDSNGVRRVAGVWSRDTKWSELSGIASIVATAVDAPADAAIEQVRVASVAGDEVNQLLATEMARCWSAPLRFAKTEARRDGLTNSYADPSRMGVDRWLAMLGAWSGVRAALCVVSCGTAVTIDLLDNSGKHLGGYILPGLVMMTESLRTGTGRVRFDTDEPRWGISPGKSTASAVHHGAVLAVSGALSRTLSERDNGSLCYLTGGDAETIAGHMAHPVQIVEELVLDGLAIALP